MDIEKLEEEMREPVSGYRQSIPLRIANWLAWEFLIFGSIFYAVHKFGDIGYFLAILLVIH